MTAHGRFADDPTRTYWTRERCLEALFAWVAEHGEPPAHDEWERARPSNPAAFQIRRKFGSWTEFVIAAGYAPRKNGPRPRWTRDRIAAAMLDWLLRCGRWPTQNDWSRSTDEHPHATTVTARFGSWNAGKRHAGWEPNQRTPRNTACIGCGGEFENYTDDCVVCRERRRARERRARKAETAAITNPGAATVSDERTVAA